MRYVSTADTGMKTGNMERLQAPSMLEIAPAELWERRKRVVCAAKCALLKGVLPAVCVSAMVQFLPAPRDALSQGQPLSVNGDAGLGFFWAGQIRNTATAMTPLAHKQVRKGQKAPPSHPNQELGDILSLGSRKMILGLTVDVQHVQPSPRAEPAQGWALPLPQWMVIQSLMSAMVMVSS